MAFSLLQDLPFEIIMTILMMLPVESLICLMCVSKSWYSFISCGEFIQEHFKKSILGGNRFILCGPKIVESPPKPFGFLSYRNPCISYMEGIPCKLDSDSSHQIGSSGGLICLTDLKKYGTTIHIWNPCIRNCRTIRSSSIDVSQRFDNFSFLVIGFGYVPEINEHKVVRIAYVRDGNNYDLKNANNWEDNDFGDIYGDRFKTASIGDEISSSVSTVYNRNITEVEVYSLSTDTWEKIELPSFPWFMCDYFSRVLVNNCLHWLAFPRKKNDEKSLVLSFDLVNEVFQQITLPNFDIDLTKYTEITVYKGSLSFLIVYPFYANESGSFWVMNDYGRPESWTNIFNIILDTHFHWPSIITSEDEILLSAADETNQAYLYNFLNQSRRVFNIQFDCDELDFVPMISNLILLDGKKESMETNCQPEKSNKGKDNQKESLKKLWHRLILN